MDIDDGLIEPGDLLDFLGDDSGSQASGGFIWTPCGYVLMSEEGQRWMMREDKLAIQLNVRMQRIPPSTSDAAGSTFRWHKNCVLPGMRISVESYAGTSLEGAAVMISAVVVDALSNSARSVGLTGTYLRPLVNRECTFASLSFRTTSWNLPGRPRLHIMASLLLRSHEAERPNSGLSSVAPAAESARETFEIACSTLSPALTVDARKRHSSKATQPTIDAGGAGSSGVAALSEGSVVTAEVQASSASPMTTAVLPFAPHLLEATLHKVGKDSAVPIENSLDGLRNYLSALNIRNKCKHPLFLALRFDSCIGLLYDSTSVRNPAGDDDAFYMMMGAIGGDGGRGATSCGHSQTGFAPFVLAVKDHHHGDGVACKRTDCPIRLSAGITLPHHSGLPASYLMLCDQQVSALRKTYCRLHCKHVPSPYHTRVPVPSLAGVGTCVPSPGKLPVPPICHTCHSPHLGEPPSSEDQDLQAAQRYAKDMLATARQMGANIAASDASAADGAEGEHSCPEREWQMSLRILVEALSMHCRTKSPDEIVAFMHDELVSSGKRLSNGCSDVGSPSGKSGAAGPKTPLRHPSGAEGFDGTTSANVVDGVPMAWIPKLADDHGQLSERERINTPSAERALTHENALMHYDHAHAHTSTCCDDPLHCHQEMDVMSPADEVSFWDSLVHNHMHSKSELEDAWGEP
jgi:hypothetical protein